MDHYILIIANIILFIYLCVHQRINNSYRKMTKELPASLDNIIKTSNDYIQLTVNLREKAAEVINSQQVQLANRDYVIACLQAKINEINEAKGH